MNKTLVKNKENKETKMKSKRILYLLVVCEEFAVGQVIHLRPFKDFAVHGNDYGN